VRRLPARLLLALRRLTWLGFLVTHTPVAVVAETVRPGRGHAARIASRGARRLMRALGVRFEVRGLERVPPGASYVFTANHRSHFDIPALLAALPSARFAAKQELFAQPVLAAAMRALGVIPIDREHPEAAKRVLELAARTPGGGGSLVIFPEGEEAEPGQMLPFKAGAFVFALRTGLPVVPVAIHNTAAILPRGDALAISSGRVVVEVLDPIETQGFAVEDRTRLAAQVRAALQSVLRPCDGGSAERADLGPF
jgi:1-acyl-sn-glycerol-3-phosphate acyltransferase